MRDRHCRTDRHADYGRAWRRWHRVAWGRLSYLHLRCGPCVVSVSLTEAVTSVVSAWRCG
ncbi:hypothetical protein XCR_0541 [Xanthomonas campestris pv. raphani 756C]|nr:hypothetical protein XCR_0541 [Xanthomonas campestris pv. raphani 756C]